MAGGSTGYSGTADIADFSRDNVGLIFMGLTSESHDLSGNTHTGGVPYANEGTYSDNPSVLRYIKDYALTGAGGNPYTGVDAFDSTDRLENMSNASEVSQDAVDAVISETIYSDAFTNAVEKLSDIEAFGELDISALIEALIAPALTSSLTSLQQESTQAKIISDTHMSSYISNAKNNQKNIVQEADIYTKTILSNLYQKALIDTKGNVSSLESSAREGSITSATEVVTANNPDMGIFTSALSLISGAAQATIRSAISSSLSMVDTSIVDAAVKEFERSAMREHMRSVNRFAGGMADINAVNSSAFIIGMALQEADFQSDINRFRSELTLKLYDQAMSLYAQSMQVYTQNYFTLYLEKYNAFIKAYAESMPFHMQLFLSNLPVYMQTYLNILSTAVSGVDRRVADSYSYASPIMSLGVGNLQEILANKVKGLVSMRLQEKQDKDAFLNASIQMMMDAIVKKASLSLDQAKLLVDVNRIAIEESRTDLQDNLEIDAKESTWDITIFQDAANIFSASNGSVVPTQKGPSKTQRTASGFIGGAGAGASIGGLVGGPIGAGIGAIVGGFAGVL